MSGLVILCQFLFRLSFGMAAGMAVTSPHQVTSGYFRNHLYVLLGLNVLATLVAATNPEHFALWPPLLAAVISYIGAICWLYEWRIGGIVSLWAVAGTTLCGALQLTQPLAAELASKAMADDTEHLTPTLFPASIHAFAVLDPITSGLVLGITIAAMFLGHWYLNTPTMRIVPLQRLVILMAVAVLLRAAVSGTGLGLTIAQIGMPDFAQWAFIALRWLSGIFGLIGIVWMTWDTLKIPNTQAATGMLYVGVIAVFLGELTSLLLSNGKPLPL